MGPLARTAPIIRSLSAVRGLARALAGVFVSGLLLAACSSDQQSATIGPTLNWRTIDGNRIAFQNGIPVPTFSYQPRLRLDVSGDWRLQTTTLNDQLSLMRRPDSLPRILQEAHGRQAIAFDDRSWPVTQVPGTYNPPPSPGPNGAWYRKAFDIPDSWGNHALTLKFGAVNYIADVWLNGQYLGYHEGGSTPFAFDATAAITPGATNLLAVRVDNPAWGTRQDIVPWGLTDWWNYGGLLQPVWLEATSSVYAVRADVVPHLDGADISVVVHQRGGDAVPAAVGLDILPATVNPQNVSDPDPRTLVPPAALPLASDRVDAGQLQADGTTEVHSSFSITDPDLWSPSSPALYVLHVRILVNGYRADDLFETFGLRHIAVDPGSPRLFLNGQPVDFSGVALHDERVFPPAAGRPHGGPVTSADDVLILLEKAASANAQMIRADHHPANPILLNLADRLGFGVWEELPLYHYTPVTFDTAMGRGIPQQMLSEMDLRDMDHPSVLFHGLSNESTGQAERQRALTTLHNLDRLNDGTRLTGQAGYGFQPDDRTSQPLDVAGYTFYYGVFYGNDPAGGTAAALQTIHATFPRKPVMALEFGHWADNTAQEPLQRNVLTETYTELARQSDVDPSGFVAGSIWWTLDDYWTMAPGLSVEHFGMFTPSGTPRLAAQAAADLFGGGAGQGPSRRITSRGFGQPRLPAEPTSLFLAFIGYGLLVSLALLGTFLLILVGLPRTHRRPQ